MDAAQPRSATIHRVGLLLAGCGRLDGSDPIPTVLAWTALDEADVDVFPCAPDIAQFDTLHPLTTVALDPRNARTEAARIGGECHPAGAALAATLDALVIPGGLGVVKSLWPTAASGPEAEMDASTLAMLQSLRARRCPIAVLDEAIALVAKVWSGEALQLAGGPPSPLRDTLAELGHVVQAGYGPVVDETHQVFSAHSAPGRDPREVAKTVRNLVSELLAALQPR